MPRQGLNIVARQKISKVASYFLGAAVVACVLLCLTRLAHCFTFPIPLLMVTTGCEDESLFAMWKHLHGQAVYADPNKIPFATSYFNWGFYVFYGTIIKFCIETLHLADTWIPSVGRIISFGFTLMLGWAFYRILKKFCGDVGSYLETEEPLSTAGEQRLEQLFDGARVVKERGVLADSWWRE